jgi:hypothetical protein
VTLQLFGHFFSADVIGDEEPIQAIGCIPL